MGRADHSSCLINRTRQDGQRSFGKLSLPDLIDGRPGPGYGGTQWLALRRETRHIDVADRIPQLADGAHPVGRAWCPDCPTTTSSLTTGATVTSSTPRSVTESE